MRTTTKWLLPCVAAWWLVACGGSETAVTPTPPSVLQSSTAPTAPAAEPITFRACCDSGERDGARR